MSPNRRRPPTNRRRFRPGLVPLESRKLLSGDVTTFHDDNYRTGANTEETTLTPANVNSVDFGKVNTFSTDGKVDSQPLYISGVAIPGQGTHDVLYVTTESDSLYAFDARTGQVLWHDGPSGTPTSLLQAGETNVYLPKYFPAQGDTYVGINSTPVIDAATNTLYLVAESVNETGPAPVFYERIHAIDIRTGEDVVPPKSVDSSIKMPGTGPGSDGTAESFNPELSRSRAALAISDGVLYIGWTSNSGVKPYEGWLMAFGESDLSLLAFRSMNANFQEVGNDTVASSGGSIWMSGGGLAVDGQGDIMFVTGNGPYDLAGGNFGDSVLKFSPAGQGLNVVDNFTPYNQEDLAYRDFDLGSSAIVLLPPIADASGHVYNLAVNSGKDGNIYVTDTDDLGGNQASGNRIHQEIQGAFNGLSLSSPTYWNNSVYLNAIGFGIDAFTFDGNAQLGATASSTTGTIFGYPGSTPSISADGDSNGILWAIEMGSTGVLHAYDATNLADELYNSNQAAGGRDQFGPDSRFITPTISHGMVYVGTPTGVAVFGLLNPPTITTTTTTTTNDPIASTPAPTVAVAAFSSTSFTVGGLDLLGAVGASSTYAEGTLTYTWSVISTPSGVAAPALGPNGTNDAKLIPADITAAGTYVFQVVITDPIGQSITSDVAVTAIDPAPTVAVAAFSSPTFVVGGADFLGGVGSLGSLDPSQLTYTWSVLSQPAGSPTVSFGANNGTATSGLVAVGVAAPGAYGFRLTIAGPDGQAATSDVGVLATVPAPSIAVPAFATPVAYVGGVVQLGAVGQDQAFPESALIYDWTPVAEPEGAKAPRFSTNGTNASKLVNVSFTTPGTYTFRVTVMNPFYETAVSDVTVVVGPRRTVSIRTSGGKKTKAT